MPVLPEEEEGGPFITVFADEENSQDYVYGVLAHEVGHNQRDDGGVVLALRRLVNPVLFLLGGNVRDFSTGKPLKRDMRPVDKFFLVVNHLG